MQIHRENLWNQKREAVWNSEAFWYMKFYRGTNKSYPEERTNPREQKILRKRVVSEVNGRESSKKKKCSDMMKVTSNSEKIEKNFHWIQKLGAYWLT